MFEPVDESGRSVGDVLDMPVADVGLQDGDDFVVSFVAVDHAETADRDGADNEVTVGGGSLGQDADVEGVAIAADGAAPDALFGESRDRVAAERLRDEAVGRGAHAGETLRPIDAQM